MDFKSKRYVLGELYRLHDDFTKDLDAACRRSCAHCCTCNVTLTTIEAYEIAEHLISGEGRVSIEALRDAYTRNHYRPRATINRLAEICAGGGDPPEEENDPAWGRCPFLADDECPIYAIRPFACRCMTSTRACGETGLAHMDSFTITVNNLFMQFIEHIDVRGCTGSLLDVLPALSSDDRLRQYRENRLSCADSGLLPNQPIPVLMIPPEHRTRIEPVLEAIRGINVQGK